MTEEYLAPDTNENAQSALPAVGAEELSVTNSLSFMDMLYCTSMPYHPLTRMGIFSLSAIFGMSVALAVEGISALTYFYLVLPIMLVGLMVPLNAYWVLNKNRDRFTDQNIVVSPAGVYSETKLQSRSLVAWRKVVAIKKIHGAITIQISKSPSMYFWLSRKSFSSDEAYEEYYRRTIDFWNAAQTDVRGQTELYDVSSPAADRALADHQRVVADLTMTELLIGNWARRGPTIIMAVAALFFCAGVSFFVDASLSLTVLLLALAGFLMALVPLQTYLGYKRHPEWMRGEIAISPEEFVSRGAGCDGVIPWSSIKKVELKHKIIFLHLKTNWSIYIPVRCFTSSVDADVFYDDAKRYCEVAKRALPKAK